MTSNEMRYLKIFIDLLYLYSFFKNVFIYFWLRWVFVAACGLSLVVAHELLIAVACLVEHRL